MVHWGVRNAALSIVIGIGSIFPCWERTVISCVDRGSLKLQAHIWDDPDYVENDHQLVLLNPWQTLNDVEVAKWIDVPLKPHQVIIIYTYVAYPEYAVQSKSRILVLYSLVIFVISYLGKDSSRIRFSEHGSVLAACHFALPLLYSRSVHFEDLVVPWNRSWWIGGGELQTVCNRTWALRRTRAFLIYKKSIWWEFSSVPWWLKMLGKYLSFARLARTGRSKSLNVGPCIVLVMALLTGRAHCSGLRIYL